MSTAPSVPISPFVPETTPTIDRANRLLSLKDHPGFREVIRISMDLVNEAREVADTYPGWDKDQLFALFTRAKTASEFHKMLFYKISEAIAAGVAEAKEALETASPAAPQRATSEVMEQGDYVRREVLGKFDEMDTRTPGSY